MGVRGLKTYLEKYCPDACYEIDLPAHVNEYKSKTGKVPEIVVDGHSCMRKWYEGLDWTIGLEVQELIEKMRNYVESLMNIGVKLTFYFGGVNVDHRYDVWRRRQKERIDRTQRVFDFLRGGEKSSHLPEELQSMPVSMGVITSFILKHVLKCTVHVCVEDADDEIIRHVHMHNSYAILSQDTDFVITNVRCLMLLSESFNPTTLKVKCYDRVRFSKNLGIRPEELPLYAILNGNDHIPQDIVRPFHRKLCNKRGNGGISYTVLMPALGRYIKNLQPENRKLEKIFQEVFRGFTSLKFDEIKLAHDLYFVHEKRETTPSIEDDWGKIVAKAEDLMVNVTLHHFIYDVIKNQRLELSVNLEDFRVINDKSEVPNQRPSVTITRCLRQRIYGILLMEKKEEEDLVIKEWCAENMHSYDKPAVVKPILPPKDYHPGLLELWSPNEGDSCKTESQFKLFLWAISPKIEDSIEPWMSLSNDLVVITASIYYLFKEEPSYMKEWEAYAIMATTALHPFYDCAKLRSLNNDKLEHDLRHVHLSVAVIRTFYLIFGLMGACGFPVPLSEDTAYMKFEGKLFQVIYNKAKSGKTYEELCENNATALNTFHQMRDIIFKE